MTKSEQRVKEYFSEHPNARACDAVKDLGLSRSTVNKFMPAELKPPPPSREEMEALVAQYKLEKAMYEKLDPHTIKEVRDFNRYRLHPIEWGRVRANYTKMGRKMPFECKSAEEFQQLLKEVCDTLYGWHLYEKCPECGEGIIIPVWHGGQRSMHCGCSNYPDCEFSKDMDGNPVFYRTPWKEYHPPLINLGWQLRPEMDEPKVICLDTETTGLHPLSGDEILQLSIIDGAGNVLFDEYIKPKVKTSWESAQAVNGISPEMVQNKATIDQYIPRLNEILNGADVIVGYNIFFDLDFMEQAGICLPVTAQYFDVMDTFAAIFGEWDSRHHDFTWQKLTTCAAFYGYEGNGNFHDSLEDVRATLFCYFAMTKEPEVNT